MNTNDKTQYEKAAEVAKKKHSLTEAVKAQPSAHWAKLLQKHVADSRIRGWAASIIWWAYPSKATPERGQILCEMMELFRPSVFGRDEELNVAFEKLGLPKPVHETFQNTHPQSRRSKVLGHL